MIRLAALDHDVSKQNDELKHRVYNIFTPPSADKARGVAAYRRDAPTATRVRGFLIVLIWTLVIVIILASYSSLYTAYQHLFDAWFVFAIAVFTIELVLRLWSVRQIHSSAIQSKAD